MKRPPQIAEELEEKELDKLLFLEVLVFKFYHTLCHFFVVTDFFVVTFCLQERRRRLDQTLYHIRGVDVLFRWSLGTN